MQKLKKQAKNMSRNITILDQKPKTKVNAAYRSSTAFFQQLQDKTTQMNNGKLKQKSLKENEMVNEAKKLKL